MHLMGFPLNNLTFLPSYTQNIIFGTSSSQMNTNCLSQLGAVKVRVKDHV